MKDETKPKEQPSASSPGESPPTRESPQPDEPEVWGIGTWGDVPPTRPSKEE